MSKKFSRRNKTTGRTRELKESVITLFDRPRENIAQVLSGFNDADWRSILWWLDVNGMAIYFLDRTRHLQVEKLIPKNIAESLVRRLDRNRVRMDSLLNEASTLATWFEGGGIPYALLKGITLTPESVSDISLRCQADIDFLIPIRCADHAGHYLRRVGYRLHAKSGNTLEFRAGQVGEPDLAAMYSVNSQRALELHLISEVDVQPNLLTRRVRRVFQGTCIDTLSPADILVQQSLHILKHFCGEHTRLSWVLEFHRHARTRSKYPEFWSSAQSIAHEEFNGDLAMGVAFWIAEEMFGKIDLQTPQQWRAEALPARIRLWMERYARKLLTRDSIGSKLYALLRNEIPSQTKEVANRKLREIMFPLCLPVPLTHPGSNESLTDRLRRLALEIDYFFRRLEFHLVEGLRLGAEVVRWKKAATRCR